MSPSDAAWAVGIGLVAGVLSGLFGVGGGIVMTPGIDTFLPVPPIAALETPLPVIFPTALAGAYTYRRAGQVDVRAASWMAPPGLVGSVVGAIQATEDYHLYRLYHSRLANTAAACTAGQ